MIESGYEVVEASYYVVKRWERKKVNGKHTLSIRRVSEEFETHQEAEAARSAHIGNTPAAA